MPASRLKEFLDRQGVRYVSLTHSVGYTAQEIASLAHIPGRELAKTVMVLVDGRLAMAVLPASLHVSLPHLQQLTGGKHIVLASEPQFREAFGDCETGAMPPFGNLYGVPVYVDETLSWDNEIAFNAGTHRELISMSYDDFARLVKPSVGEFAVAPYELAAAR